MHPAIIDWCRNCAQAARTTADISASNEELWTVFLVLGIFALALFIIGWFLARGRG